MKELGINILLASIVIAFASGVSAQSDDEPCTGEARFTDIPCEWPNAPKRRSPDCCDHYRECVPSGFEVQMPCGACELNSGLCRQSPRLWFDEEIQVCVFPVNVECSGDPTTISPTLTSPTTPSPPTPPTPTTATSLPLTTSPSPVCPPIDVEEATIMGSYSNPNHPFMTTGHALIDHKDINGITTGTCSSVEPTSFITYSVQGRCRDDYSCTCGGCAVASNIKWKPGGARDGPQQGYLALELSPEDARKKVVGVKVARRRDPYAPAPHVNHDAQAKNVKVLVGPSFLPSSEDRLCTYIPELREQAGDTMVDYMCNPYQQNIGAGQYVKFLNDQDYLTICEARVLVSGVTDQEVEECLAVQRATIEGTASNTGHPFSETHEALTDGKDINGIITGSCTSWVGTCGFCAVSGRRSSGRGQPQRTLLSVRLSDKDAKKNVVRVRLSRRIDPDGLGYHDSQARNVKVMVGPSEGYDAGDGVCTEIAELREQTGLTGDTMVDYECDRGHYAGKYVKFTSDQLYLTICEAQVFVESPSR